MSIKKTMGNVIKKISDSLTKSINTGRYFDMSTPESRQQTVEDDYDYAKTNRAEQQEKWQMFDRYYNGEHVASIEIADTLEKDGIPFVPAIVPDPYIHVESQIIPSIPGFEFSGRDSDTDSVMAKEREYAVRFVMQQNKVESMNTENERRVNKLGNAFWKVSWDGEKVTPNTIGDIVIGNPDPANIFPDPSGIDVQSCEYFIYVYRLHRRAAARQFAEQLDELGITINDIGDDGNQYDTSIYMHQIRDLMDDTVQIMEYWFKQATSGETADYKWVPGDIACSIQINNKEVKYIPKYWVKTGEQCKLFPFVKYCKISMENSFWDKSDLETIIPLTDQCDRELSMAILNDSFMSNDIIVDEVGSRAEGTLRENKPGAIWSQKEGMVNGVRRLGGVSNSVPQWNMIDKLREIIKQTVGNFDINMGDAPPANVKTLGGIIELKEQGNKRQNIKKVDRTIGFEQLLELIDWHVLEFYDDNRMIYIGAKNENEKPVSLVFNSDRHNVGDSENPYFPRVDTTISVGDGIENSPSMTLMATENLLSKPINAQNYKLVAAMVDLMQLPNRKDLKEWLESTFGQPPQQQQEKPNISIAYRDLMPDAQAQLLQQIGIQSQGGVNPMEDGQQGQGQIDPQEILNQLSPEELQHIQENPQLLDELLQQMGGGQGNGQPEML